MPNASILIVDDEPDFAEVLADRLEANGYDVRIAHRARECYALVAEAEPDLIMLDIQMPEISGMEALVELKIHHPRVPVLMMSASVVQTAARESVEKGAAGFLKKPFEPEELMQKVRAILAADRNAGPDTTA